MNSTVLVVGGAGYIGSHVCKKLASKGYNPVVVDNLSNGFKYLVKWGEFEKADIRDKEEIKRIIDKHNPVAVMHFAAHIAVGESVENPYKYYNNNVCGTLELLSVMNECDVKNIIFSSTAATYGNPQMDKITEEHPKNPINPYGRSKLMVEEILEDFNKAYGLNYIALRYFNAAGADIDCETGCDQAQVTNLIPVMTQVLAGEREKLSIFGKDYDTPDGTCVRDYIHVNDLAEAHIMALEYLLDKGVSDVFNLGTGSGYSVQEVVDTAKEVTGIEFDYEYVYRRAGDPALLVADSSKAQRILGWKPEYSDLKIIIDTAWKWKSKGNR